MTVTRIFGFVLLHQSDNRLTKLLRDGRSDASIQPSI